MDKGYTAYDNYVTQDGLKGFGLVLDYMTSDLRSSRSSGTGRTRSRWPET